MGFLFVIAFLRFILMSFFPMPLFIMLASKKFGFCDWFFFLCVLYCFVLFIKRTINEQCIKQSLFINETMCLFKSCMFFSAYLLYITEAKFVIRTSCIVLSSKKSKKACHITTINTKPIRPYVSKICTRYSKLKYLVHSSISLCKSVRESFVPFCT